ncbi:hypothetical protein E4N62_13305 [Streptomyces sp. MNU76]|uniref:hypothetical protein n=1 Tax=Streptomyces sp. MNU76 TaxID=2560026 RepID=UPI001E350600|nr:hypothetical protein [Streptomyces sp. MNU76]MCC9706159.1 hypothetical protein [Streptomyces sp. MNU76]
MVEDDGSLAVRCFSQDGEDRRDYDFSRLRMAPGLRDALLAAFVKRTAPGAGLTSLQSVNKVHGAVVRLDHYLETLAWPPTELAHLTAEHIDGFYQSRRHIDSIRVDLSHLRQLLALADGVSDAVSARLAGPLPKQIRGEGRRSYSRAELKRITEASRADLRAAAARIRGNRELLQRVRRGEDVAQGDRSVARRLELLDWVDRFADVPRASAPSPSASSPFPRPCTWVSRLGSVVEFVSALHLTIAETAAGAVLLAAMTGENPEVILKTPAVHHRADGYTGERATAIVGVRKPRRGRRAYMDLALSEIPDWISIPAEPEEVTTRDELHTPFGLYLLLHELTRRSRALTDSDRLLVGYCAAGGKGASRGLRPLTYAGLHVSQLGRTQGLLRDDPDGRGEPVPLPLRLDLLRLTFIELHQMPVAHTEQTAATSYLARNRGNITEYRKVVAATLVDEVAKARTLGAVAVMSAQDVERARTDPDAVAAEHRLDIAVLRRVIARELDTVLAACTDNRNGPHGPPGQPCPASFMLCLGCECARALPHHLPVQVLVHDRLAERREQLDPLQWAERFAGPHAQLADLLDQHDEAAVTDARHCATDADRSLAERLLNRELDLR